MSAPAPAAAGHKGRTKKATDLDYARQWADEVDGVATAKAGVTIVAPQPQQVGQRRSLMEIEERRRNRTDAEESLGGEVVRSRRTGAPVSTALAKASMIVPGETGRPPRRPLPHRPARR